MPFLGCPAAPDDTCRRREPVAGFCGNFSCGGVLRPFGSGRQFHRRKNRAVQPAAPHPCRTAFRRGTGGLRRRDPDRTQQPTGLSGHHRRQLRRRPCRGASVRRSPGGTAVQRRRSIHRGPFERFAGFGSFRAHRRLADHAGAGRSGHLQPVQRRHRHCGHLCPGRAQRRQRLPDRRFSRRHHGAAHPAGCADRRKPAGGMFPLPAA